VVLELLEIGIKAQAMASSVLVLGFRICSIEVAASLLQTQYYLCALSKRHNGCYKKKIVAYPSFELLEVLFTIKQQHLWVHGPQKIIQLLFVLQPIIISSPVQLFVHLTTHSLDVGLEEHHQQSEKELQLTLDTATFLTSWKLVFLRISF
jgi:hypothetical protein